MALDEECIQRRIGRKCYCQGDLFEGTLMTLGREGLELDCSSTQRKVSLAKTEVAATARRARGSLESTLESRLDSLIGGILRSAIRFGYNDSIGGQGCYWGINGRCLKFLKNFPGEGVELVD